MKRRVLILLAQSAALCAALVAPGARAGWTLVGTMVQGDRGLGVPGARITRFPDTLTVRSDEAGDFFLPWDGSKGWLTFLPPEDQVQKNEEVWCRRYSLGPRDPARGDSILDVGLIPSDFHRPVPNSASPRLPPAMRPLETVSAAGPAPGELDRYWIVIRFTTDPWGTVVEAKAIAGDPAPARLQDPLLEWIRRVPWQVERLSPCKFAEPFISIEHYFYEWQDSLWVYHKERNPRPGAAGGDPPGSRP